MKQLSCVRPSALQAGPNYLPEESADAAQASPLGLRQLRHHTKNVLQRIVAQVEATEPRNTSADSALADDVLHRIILSTQISDALFGLSVAPDVIERRLEWLTKTTVALLSDDVQTIRTEVETVEHCPEPFVPVVLQIAHEMVANAVKHGMRLRLVGRIFVLLRTSPDSGVTLTVLDDGWGPGTTQIGEGRSIMAALAGQHGGTVSLTRKGAWTVATLSIPGSSLPETPVLS
jgi:two-component sensor histidine kinase